MGQPDRHSSRTSPETQPRKGHRPLQDADVVVPLGLVAPLFLAVVVRTAVRGETFGAEATVCAAMVVLFVMMLASAWRARRRRASTFPATGPRADD
jgi:hypothetical protein